MRIIKPSSSGIVLGRNPAPFAAEDSILRPKNMSRAFSAPLVRCSSARKAPVAIASSNPVSIIHHRIM